MVLAVLFVANSVKTIKWQFTNQKARIKLKSL